MPNRLKLLLERIVFAGLQPGQAQAPGKRLRWLGPLAGPVDRFLSGGSRPSDPLYLSNRTLGQRLRLAGLIAVPVLILGGLIALALSNRYTASSRPAVDPTREQLAAHMNDVLKDVQIERSTDVQVVEAVIVKGSPRQVSGVIQNNTDRAYRAAELVFDLTNSQGSQVGGVNTTVYNIEPKSTQKFHFPIKQDDAAFVLV